MFTSSFGRGPPNVMPLQASRSASCTLSLLGRCHDVSSCLQEPTMPWASQSQSVLGRCHDVSSCLQEPTMPWASQSQSSFTFCLLGRCHDVSSCLQEPTMPWASQSQSSFTFCLLERGDGGSSCLQASILIYMYCMKGNQLLSPNHHTWKTLVFIVSAKKWCAKTSQSLCGAMFGSMFASCIPTQLCLHWDRRYNEVGKWNWPVVWGLVPIQEA